MRAAYGFRIDGGPDDGWFALQGADDWPLLTIAVDETVSVEDQARVDWGRFHADVCAQLPQDELVHPVLGRMLPLLVDARGVDALHGGALVAGGRAWIVVGPREAGKSSLLAQCHRAGAAIATDDIVVLEGTRCLAGPRCIDLRADPARRLGPGVAVREGTKQRIKLPAGDAETELAGVVYLGWGDALELVELRPSESMVRLAELRARDGWPRSRTLVLDLAGLPAYELRRPHGLDSLEPSAELLLDRLGAQR